MTENARKKRRARRKEKRRERARELKLEREEKQEHKFARCSKKKQSRLPITKHHLIPRSRGGINIPENILLLEKGRHECWHCLFGNMTLEEVISNLTTLQQKLEGLWQNCSQSNVMGVSTNVTQQPSLSN